MPTKREERERMRQERLAAQQAASSSERRRLLLGYAVAGVLVAAIVAGIFVAITGGDEGDGGPDSSDYPEAAHIQPDLGAVPEEMQPDAREGVAPPPVENGDLEQAADIAGCDLQLDLPDEGNNHFLDEDRDPGYKTNPPTSGD